MYVIGISSGIKHGHHDGAAVLLRDGELIAAAEEERFTLAKHARGELPRGAIGFCLKQAGITMRDVDWICSPLKTYIELHQRLTEYFKFQFGHSPKIELYDHHLCHAASTFYGSGFAEATVACFDFSGDSSSGLVAHANGNDFRVLTRFGRHNSLGLYYGMLTQYLGYQMTNDEYKVMGLSSYGSPRISRQVRQAPASEWHRLRTRSRARQAQARRRDLHQRFLDAAGAHLHREDGGHPGAAPACAGSRSTSGFTDIAASGQKQLEIVTTEVIARRDRETGCGDVCIAGGVALELQDEHGDRGRAVGRQRLYVPPVPHDAGVALGAAMMKCAEAGHAIAPLTHAYWGPEYSNDTIKETLDKIGARYELLDDPVARCVTDLVEQKTVGWFQGRMEYGPRALGNRSILADPRSCRHEGPHQPRHQVSRGVPSVLSVGAVRAPGRVFRGHVRRAVHGRDVSGQREVKQTIPAVVHVDGTARIQSVHAETNPLYSRLIGEFGKATSVPILINTSLNINEQPTVNSPLEALHTYFCSGLDVLFLGPYRLSKSVEIADRMRLKVRRYGGGR